MGKLDETDQIKKLSDELSKLRDTYAGELRQRAWLVSERDRAQAQQANAQRQLDTHMAQVEAAECRAPEHGFEQADIVRAQWQQRAVAAEEVCDRWGTRVRELEGERDAARACYDALCVGLLAAYEDDAGFGDTMQALIDGLSEQTMDWADAAALSRTRAEAAEARAEMWRERTIAAAEEKRDELADAVCAPLKWDEWSAALFAEPVNTTLDETPLAEQKDARGDHWRARALAAEATVVAAQAAAIQWEARARAAESAEFSNADQLYEAAAWQERALTAEKQYGTAHATWMAERGLLLRDRDEWKARTHTAEAAREECAVRRRDWEERALAAEATAAATRTERDNAAVRERSTLTEWYRMRDERNAADSELYDALLARVGPTGAVESAETVGQAPKLLSERNIAFWRTRAKKAEAEIDAAQWPHIVLTGERDTLIRERDALTEERDAMMAERDSMTAERDARDVMTAEWGAAGLAEMTADRDEWRTRAEKAEAEHDALAARTTAATAVLTAAVAARIKAATAALAAALGTP